MKKFLVRGSTTVEVSKEVWANTEEAALEKAYEELSCLEAYCGNGGCDKLIGVDGDGESVDVYDDIIYESAEEIEDDPDYFICLECESQCEKCSDEYGVYYLCEYCGKTFDEDEEEIQLDDRGIEE